MKQYDDMNRLLKSLHDRQSQLAIKKDLSKEPDIFKTPLRLSGVYLYGRAFSETSKRLSTLELDMIIFNKIRLEEIIPPEGYLVFRLRDLQEFPYSAAVRVPPPIKK